MRASPLSRGRVSKMPCLEAVDSGIKFIVSPVERVPLYDILEMVAYTKQKGVQLLGPGSIGIISPGIAAAGWLGGTPEFARRVFVPGPSGSSPEAAASQPRSPGRSSWRDSA